MGNKSKIGAVVLAAGYSSRMGHFKPLLPFAGATVIESIIHMFRRAGITEIIVVVGHRADELIPVLDGLAVRHIMNEKYDEGMFSSIVKGVQALTPEIEGFFLLPGDMPLVKSHTIRLLCRKFRKTNADVVYPVFQNHRGHPPLIGAKCIADIILGKQTAGLRQILAGYEVKCSELEVIDEGILQDLDTQEDYQKVDKAYHRHIPTPAECDEILSRKNVANRIRTHGRVVAEVSRKLAIQLNQAGLHIDVNAVIAAGKLHDIAKGKVNHAKMGARIIRNFGYPKIAEMIATHTDIVLGDEVLPDEATVLYLADKLVKGDCIVTLEERLSSAMEKYRDDIEAAAMIRKRHLCAQKIATAVEQLLAVSLVKVLEEPCYL